MKNGDKQAVPVAHHTRFEQGDHGYTHAVVQQYTGGLTKREHFAGLAMQGIIGSGNVEAKDVSTIPEGVANAAVMYADALLAALEEGDEK